ncbi:hypothetical protein [Nocardia cyriacigeorgica]|uniref:hypothetical protein n=1 Tax=Nocardia cyriacigeorgica TaxID=135487 RepID=UPI002457AC68|nr:hypothetical protein [Nocardia cyriacigeorgica]
MASGLLGSSGSCAQVLVVVRAGCCLDRRDVVTLGSRTIARIGVREGPLRRTVVLPPETTAAPALGARVVPLGISTLGASALELAATESTAAPAAGFAS